MDIPGLIIYLPVLALLAFLGVLLVVMSAMRTSRRKRAEESAAADIAAQIGTLENAPVPGFSVLPGHGAPQRGGAPEPSSGEYSGARYVEDPHEPLSYAESPDAPAPAATSGPAPSAPAGALTAPPASWARDEAVMWLAHRAHTCTERQLDFLHEVRSAQGAPQNAAQGPRDLFPLEHLATQARRAVDGVLTLAGDPAYRPYARPVPLSEVVRAAALSLPSYDRVDLDLEADPKLNGDAAGALSHLLAECLDPLLQRQNRAVVTCQRARDGYEITLVDEDPETGAAPVIGLSDDDLNRGMSWLVSPQGSPERPEDLAFAVAGEVARTLQLSVRVGRGWDGGTVLTVPLAARLLAEAPSPAPVAAPTMTAPEQPRVAPPVPPQQMSQPTVPTQAAPAGSPFAPPGPLSEAPAVTPVAAPVQASGFALDVPAEAPPATPPVPFRPAAVDVLPGRATGPAPTAEADEESDEDRAGRKRRRGPRKRKSTENKSGNGLEATQAGRAEPEHVSGGLPAGFPGVIPDVLPRRGLPAQRQTSPAPTEPPARPPAREAQSPGVPVGVGAGAVSATGPEGQGRAAQPPRDAEGNSSNLPQFNTSGEGGGGQSFATLPAAPAPPVAQMGGSGPFAATREQPERAAEARDAGPDVPRQDPLGGNDSASAALSELSRLFGGEPAKPAEGESGKGGVPGQRSS